MYDSISLPLLVFTIWMGESGGDVRYSASGIHTDAKTQKL